MDAVLEKECEVKDNDEVVDMIMERLKAFDAAVAESKLIKIDGVCIDNKPCETVTKESRIKVLNTHNEAAYEVSIDAIIRQPLKDLICALETGLFIRLHGITRIVGYLSRINNWNASKIGELHDRHKGDYAVGTAKPQITQIAQIGD